MFIRERRFLAKVANRKDPKFLECMKCKLHVVRMRNQIKRVEFGWGDISQDILVLVH